jgi:NADPH:quinone reductase-like Zn-dependent oxidoreductase
VLTDTFRAVRPGGDLITLGGPPPLEIDRNDIREHFFIVRPDGAQLTHLAQLAADGTLRPVIADRLPLRYGRSAFEPSTRRGPGRTILVIDRDEP